jgi:hypothetical protein
LVCVTVLRDLRLRADNAAAAAAPRRLLRRQAAGQQQREQQERTHGARQAARSERWTSLNSGAFSVSTNRPQSSRRARSVDYSLRVWRCQSFAACEGRRRSTQCISG